MAKKELSPVNVELVSFETLDSISLCSKIDKNDECGIGIAGRVDAFLGLTSDIIEISEGSKLWKVTVPDGYSLDDLLPSKKNAETVRALVKDPKGRLNGNVALKKAGVNPAQIAGVGLAAAAMVVGQAYMTEISNSLHSIDEKLDTVFVMISGEQKAKLKNALDIAHAYMNLYDDYRQKPAAAFQAARNEIERRYNDVGDVIDWVVEQLSDVEKRTKEAKPKEKELGSLVAELRSYEDQFILCLQALSALAMTRMYYDGDIDDQSALVEQQRIIGKSQGFLQKRQKLAGTLEMKIGALKGRPVSFPQAPEKNPLKRLAVQTPREAAKERLRYKKIGMQSDLREAGEKIKLEVEICQSGIDRIVLASQSARTLLTDGTSCWLIDDNPQK